MDPESSFELIQRAQAGDEGALDRLLTRYRPRLRRWAAGRLPRQARDLGDTEDLVQDALIGTIKNIHTFECRNEWALQAYLRRAVMNRLKDHFRRTKAQPAREPLADDLVDREGASPLQAALGTEVFTRYEAALATLEGIEREAVIARLELGCSYQEIAALTEKPTPDAARMTVSRALAKLAAAMAAGSAS